MRIVNQVMTSVVPDDPNGINKIIRNVANKVCIDKVNRKISLWEAVEVSGNSRFTFISI